MTSSFFVFDLDDTLAYTTRDMLGDPKRVPHLTLLRGVRVLLKSLQGHTVLLTAGTEELQWEKIDHLKLRALFTDIRVVANRQEKEQALKEIIENTQVPRERIVVVGDRIDHEIRYANQLGCTTVRMRLREGKYADKQPESGFDLPMYEVRDVAGLSEVVLRLF